MTETKQPRKSSGSELERDIDPNDPSHRDAGQEYVEERGGEANQGRDAAEQAEQERAKG